MEMLRERGLFGVPPITLLALPRFGGALSSVRLLVTAGVSSNGASQVSQSRRARLRPLGGKPICFLIGIGIRLITYPTKS
jgi:hypothetical protein